MRLELDQELVEDRIDRWHVIRCLVVHHRHVG
jgi:hypothetical protein